jgi:nitroreductase
VTDPRPGVSEAVTRRASVRAFSPEPVPGALVRELLELAHRAPSGGNLQPWRVYALAGEALAELKRVTAARLQESPRGDPMEYQVYPPELWEPFRSRRFASGEALYGVLGIERENKLGRLAQFANNFRFFDAPVGLIFTIDRRLGPPQWVDLGMYMQTLMLLAVERGLDTCAQEAWAVVGPTVHAHLGLPPEMMVFAGMALGRRDTDHPVNTCRTAREPFEDFAEMRGFS